MTSTDAAGCTVIQNPVVKDLGSAKITLSASSNALCKGQTTTISAAISGGSKPYTYSWSGGLSNQPIQTVSPGVTTPYTLQVTDSAGCVSAAQVDTIKVTPPPIVTLSADITTGCGTPLCVTFTASPAGINTQQTWSYGDNSSPDNTGKHCYTTVGKYNVQVTVDSNGCSTTAALADTIRVQFKPTPVFSYAPTSEILQDSTVHFVNLTQSATVSRWNFADLGSGANDTLTTGQGFTGSISHIFADTGTYCVKLTAYASALCYDSTTQCLTINETCHWPTSIPNVFTPNNDGKNDVFVVSSAGLSTLTCTIFNRWGMELYQYNAIESGWDGRTVGGNIAPEGTYFYIFNATCLIGNKKKEAQGYIQLQR